MNDNILFLNTTNTSSTFTSHLTSWFNLLYKVNFLPPDQNPTLADKLWTRSSSSPPDSFNCKTLLNQCKIQSKLSSQIDNLNCYMNFFTLYSTEDKYKDTSYLSWEPNYKCPGNKDPQWFDPR